MDSKNPRSPNTATIILLMVMAFLLLNFFSQRINNQLKVLTTTELYNEINKNNVAEVLVVRDTGEVSGVFKSPDGKPPSRFKSQVADVGELEKLSVAKGVPLKVVEESGSFFMFLLGLLPWILIGCFLFVVLSRTGAKGQMGGFTKPKNFKLIHQQKIKFSDVAGCDEVVAEAKSLVDFLVHGDLYRQAGVRPPRGVLFTGAPGTGKTLLAKAIAGEAGVPFTDISGSDFIEMFVGVGASRVRELFKVARKSAPCIIFIDEIDAVAGGRGGGFHNDERLQTLNALLSELDGFEDHENVLVIAATNRPDTLDPALKRPGRFDQELIFQAPDVKGREAILRVHAKNKKLAGDVDLAEIARLMPLGFTGAQIENVLNEAAKRSVDRIKDTNKMADGSVVAVSPDKVVITRADIFYGIEKAEAGLERRQTILSPDGKKVVAYHEAGHAVAVLNTPNADPLQKVTIVPRGRALGYVLQIPQEDNFNPTEEQLKARLVVLMGGRASEDLMLHKRSVGAHSDFTQACRLAQFMIAECGMSEKVGRIVYGQRQEFLNGTVTLNCSEQTRWLIEQEVKALTDEAYQKAYHILEANHEQVEKLAKALLERETLEAKEVRQLLGITPQ